MYGRGVFRGLLVTLRHFFRTYIEDFKGRGKRNFTEEGIAHKMSPDVEGTFAFQYPEEKIPVPEEFRYVPFLVYEEDQDGAQKARCTSCGICAKVCPPQCIWIVRTNDPKTGRPVPEPEEFFIDIDVCMNCGFCAEYCPFDAIKMDHDYELTVYDRKKSNIFSKEKLLKPVSYYEEIRPLNHHREETARKEAAAIKAARRARKKK